MNKKTNKELYEIIRNGSEEDSQKAITELQRRERGLLKNSTKAAITAIFSRNLSHGVGKTIINKKDKTEKMITYFILGIIGTLWLILQKEKETIMYFILGVIVTAAISTENTPWIPLMGGVYGIILDKTLNKFLN